MSKLLENIFSVKDYNETHHKLCIMGIKIKFPKREYAKKRKQNPYYYYKKNNIDITTIPPATGQLRDIQLANLTLLKELDYVCKENNLKYWLDYGTLLGAVRHKGFIPWDDDIDTAMMREDYEKIIDAFKKSSRNPDIFADYVTDKKNNCIIKIQHKKCLHLFVDIFPNDFYGKELSLEEELKITKRIKQLRKKIQIDSASNPTTEELIEVTNKYKKELFENRASNSNEIVWGLEFSHHWKNWFNKKDEIFPLQEVEFENQKFMTVNKPEVVLNKIYGDYMAYPKKLGVGHNMLIDIPEDEQKVINDLIKDMK